MTDKKESIVDKWKALPVQKKAVTIGSLLFLVTAAFPPYARNWGQDGLGESRRFAFILVDDYASQREAIYWGLLFLEWVVIALGVGLVFYLAKPTGNHGSSGGESLD